MAKQDRQPSYEELAGVVHEVAFEPRTRGFAALMEWYVERHPEIAELWSRLQEDLGDGLTLLDLAEILRLNTDGGRVPARRRTDNLVKLFKLDPRLREMWTGIEQTARDAGCYKQWPGAVREAAVYHQDVTELLAGGDVSAFVRSKGGSSRELEVYLAILERRLRRFEDVREVYDGLRRALSRPPVEVDGGA